jgi:hypothetical protein
MRGAVSRSRETTGRSLTRCAFPDRDHRIVPETNLRASPVGEARRSVSQPDVRPKGLEPLTF